MRIRTSGMTEVFCGQCGYRLNNVLEQIRQQNLSMDITHITVECPSCKAETSLFQFEELPLQTQNNIIHPYRNRAGTRKGGAIPSYYSEEM